MLLYLLENEVFGTLASMQVAAFIWRVIVNLGEAGRKLLQRQENGWQLLTQNCACSSMLLCISPYNSLPVCSWMHTWQFQPCDQPAKDSQQKLW